MSSNLQSNPASIWHPNSLCWRDVEGELIQAHGGGVLYHHGVFYWYGENRAGTTVTGEHHVTATVGVSCYRSTDLLTWRHLGVVLPAVDDPTHDLHLSKVIERPKVVYHPVTRMFVMWLHIDSPDYAAARAGVAVADNPAGPFRYIESFRPNGFMSRDQTVFADDDGRAYHLCASDHNATMMVSLLSEDWLRPSGRFIKCFPGRFMEAQALCKRQGSYHMIASGCTGWEPNMARSAVTDDLLGDWHELQSPCVGDRADKTFGGQSTFILSPTSSNSDYIAMFDVWRPDSLANSGYAWLPVRWQGDQMVIANKSSWGPAGAAAAQVARPDPHTDELHGMYVVRGDESLGLVDVRSSV